MKRHSCCASEVTSGTESGPAELGEAACGPGLCRTLDATLPFLLRRSAPPVLGLRQLDAQRDSSLPRQSARSTCLVPWCRERTIGDADQLSLERRGRR